MIQIVAYRQDNDEPVYLNTLNDESVQTTYRVQDVQDFTKRQGSFSQTFDLPFTPTNNDFFNHQYYVDIDTEDFDVYARTQVELLDDGVPVFSGYLQLLKVNLKSKTYSVSCVAEIANLARELGEKKLRDLDTSWLNTYTHALNATNIKASWTSDLVTCDVVTTSDIVYPYCDYGYGHQFDTGSTTDVMSNSTNVNRVVQDYQLRPWMRVKPIFERILTETGYSYQSSFFDDAKFKEVFLMLGGYENGVKASATRNDFRSGFNSSQNITQTGAGSYTTTLTLDKDSGTGFYDPASNFNTATYEYTAPKTGGYIFDGSWSVTINDPSKCPNDIKFEIYVNGVASGVFIGQRTFITGFSPLGAFISGSSSIFLNSGDRVTIVAVYTSIGQNIDISVNSIGSSLTLSGLPINVAGEQVQLLPNLPDMLQVDFISSIVKQFNLFIEPRQSDPTTLIIEPYPDYIDAGETIDWTDKLDLTKEVIIEPLHKYRKKFFRFEWDKDEDYLSAYRPTNGQNPLGSYTYEAADEFAEGEVSLNTKFAELPYYKLYNALVYTLRFYNSEDGTIAPMDLKPRIAYLNTQQNDTSKPAFYFYNNVQGLKTYEENPTFASNFLIDDTGTNNPIIDGTNVTDLNFGLGYTGNNGGTSAGVKNNSFELYWSRYIAEIYGKDARLLTAYFRLDTVDIHNLRFNNKIFVKDAYYRINKISNFTVGKRELTQVELIKIIDAARPLSDCDLTVSSLSIDGEVNFVDSNGDSAVATRECCEGLGYRFEPQFGETTARCYWRELTITLQPYEPIESRPYARRN